MKMIQVWLDYLNTKTTENIYNHIDSESKNAIDMMLIKSKAPWRNFPPRSPVGLLNRYSQRNPMPSQPKADNAYCVIGCCAPADTSCGWDLTDSNDCRHWLYMPYC